MRYEDLAERIAGAFGWSQMMMPRSILRWLDDHPGETPGRTITTSELGNAVRKGDSFSERLTLLGITVVPDPGPTNAEKLQELINAEWWIDYGSLAEYLDANGVKAGN